MLLFSELVAVSEGSQGYDLSSGASRNVGELLGSWPFIFEPVAMLLRSFSVLLSQALPSGLRDRILLAF